MFSARGIFSGVIGLIIGLIISILLSFPLSKLPTPASEYLPLISALFMGLMGMLVGYKKREELFFLLNSTFHGDYKVYRGISEGFGRNNGRIQYKILDTSVIIDGRIADICKSGFIEGVLIVPGFVLEELQHIADSSDVLKRNRGRRGLDILGKMQKDDNIIVQIDQGDEKYLENINEVDSKLVKLAKMKDAKIMTNDYNLNKVAELQGVSVLNINELANALKPVVLPGEEMTVCVIKDGKEIGQGVAYLDDGTMIVVDGGKKYIGEQIDVLVTSVLQTAAGRMIFAKPKAMDVKPKSMERAL